MSKKAELLQALAGQNRGLLTQELSRVAILAAIATLEDQNPTPEPSRRADLLEGDWRLLYTTSRELLGIDRYPLLQLGTVYQCIRTTSQSVYNFAEVEGIPFLEGLVCVSAGFDVLSDRRLGVNFKRSLISLQRLLDYQSPAAMIQELEAGEKKLMAIDLDLSERDRQGWVDLTYLDETLRINRGNEGSVFVLAKD
ncbi:MAG: PAP/fibrillin family protein [Cyanobacteria bacterium P01_G01_bin.54]